MKPLKRVLLFAMAIACVATPACQDGAHSNLSEDDLRKALDRACRNPLIAVAALDTTGSMKSAGTNPPLLEDFYPMIERLSECGGELAVIFIRDRAETGAERLPFPEPPAVPPRPIKREDEESYEFSDRLDYFNSKVLERQNWIEANRSVMQPRIDAFLGAVKHRMERPLANATDFNSAMNSADVVLGEGDSIWIEHPEKFLIVVSDGIDTQRRPRFAFRSGAKVYWVNATTDEKALAGLEFSRFESFAAAIRNIVEVKEKEAYAENR